MISESPLPILTKSMRHQRQDYSYVPRSNNQSNHDHDDEYHLLPNTRIVRTRKACYTCMDPRSSSVMQGFVNCCLKFIFFFSIHLRGFGVEPSTDIPFFFLFPPFQLYRDIPYWKCVDCFSTLSQCSCHWFSDNTFGVKLDLVCRVIYSTHC